MRLQKRALSIPPPKTTFPSLREEPEAFSSSKDAAVKASAKTKSTERGRHVRFVSFFVVLMALPVVSVLFMCFDICAKKGSPRDANEETGREREGGGAEDTFCFGIVIFVRDKRGEMMIGEKKTQKHDLVRVFRCAWDYNTVRAVVNASTIDRLADAVIAGANPGYRRRRSSRRRRRIRKIR